MRRPDRIDGDGLAAIRPSAAQVGKKAQRENNIAFVPDLGDVGICAAACGGVALVGAEDAGVGASPVGGSCRSRDVGVAGGIHGDGDALVVSAASNISGINRRRVRLVEIGVQLDQNCVRVCRGHAAADNARLVEATLPGIDQRESRFTIGTGSREHVGGASEIHVDVRVVGVVGGRIEGNTSAGHGRVRRISPPKVCGVEHARGA